MSGWDAYVSTQLMATGVISQAAILGKGDMQVYAQEGGFNLYPSYQATVTTEDGTEKDENIDEVSTLLAFFTSKTKPKWGIRMNQVKYQILREQDGPTLYVKSKDGGGCISATNTLVIVGLFKAGGPEAQAAAITCNTAVENLAEYLRSNQY